MSASRARSMKTLLLLIRKDALLELHAKEGVVVVAMLSFLLAVVSCFGISSTEISPALLRQLFPAITWIVFLFATTVGLGRSFEHELAEDAAIALYDAPIPLWQVFISKWLVNSAVAGLGHLVGMTTVILLLDIHAWPVLGTLVGVSLLVIGAYVAVTTIIVAMSSTSPLRHLLVPLILFPLLTPLLLAAIQLFAVVLASGSVPLESPWLSLLVVLGVVYIVAGINLYEHVVRE